MSHAINVVALVVGALLMGTPTVVATDPVAQILEPQPGLKLRQGRALAVKIRVRGGQSSELWTLNLLASDGMREIARGSGPVEDSVVVTIAADSVEKGVSHVLRLQVGDPGNAIATAETTFLVPDLPYRLIPLEEGNLSKKRFFGLLLDGSGDLAIVGGEQDGQIRVINAEQGPPDVVTLPPFSSEGQRLSKDGRWFVFRQLLNLGFYNLRERTLRQGPQTTASSFTVDSTGTRVAFQSEYDLDRTVGNPDRLVQYFLYDDTTGNVRQLTRDPRAVTLDVAPDFCPQYSASVPLISAAGDRVVLITSATLGVVAADPTAGCYVFAYDIAGRAFRHVKALSRDLVVSRPRLSNDGRWLSFTLKDPRPSSVPRLRPAILDMDSGELVEAVGGYHGFQSSDSVVSGDGSAAVISSQADLDPRVGNADHSLELFAYDRASGTFAQISETSGGIGLLPGSCIPYQPPVSDDARVTAFSFNLYSGDGCELIGPQLNEEDGFAFSRVRAVRMRPGNHGPVFDQPADARVKAGETLTVEFEASDPDVDPVVFFAQEVDALDVPLGSEIETITTGPQRSAGPPSWRTRASTTCAWRRSMKGAARCFTT